MGVLLILITTQKNNKIFISNTDNKSDNILFNKETVFYLRDVVNPFYILAILNTKNYSIKHCYDLSDNFLASVKDYKSINGIIREPKNSFIKIDKNNFITEIETKLNIKPVSQNRTIINNIKRSDIMENTKIGVIDLEVYRNSALDKDFFLLCWSL